MVFNKMQMARVPITVVPFTSGMVVGQLLTLCASDILFVKGGKYYFPKLVNKCTAFHKHTINTRTVVKFVKKVNCGTRQLPYNNASG